MAYHFASRHWGNNTGAAAPSPPPPPPPPPLTFTETLFDQTFSDVTIDVVLEQHGEEVTYIPYVGDSRNIIAEVHHEGATINKATGQRTQDETIAVLARQSATTGLVQPGDRDKITLAGDERAWQWVENLEISASSVRSRFKSKILKHQGEQGGLR